MTFHLSSGIAEIAFPPLHGGRAAELMAMQHQLDATQWWPPERMERAQFQQLARLLCHASFIPFHASRLRAAGIDPARPTAESWRRLAPLTRKDVQREGSRLHAATLPAGHGETAEAASGGSTGIPVRVRKSTLEGFFWNALHVREEIWNREDPLGAVGRLRRAPRGLTEAELAQIWLPEGLTLPDWGPPINLLWRTGPMHVLESAMPIAIQAAFLARHLPAYIFTNPSNLRLLLGHLRDEGIALPGLRSVWTLSEAVDDSLRALCREILGVRIVHNYTAAETGWMALQCPLTDVFHVQSETCLLEVVDDDNQPVPPGAIGRVLVTPLHNFAMPLLRYEIGDTAELGPPCTCGRGLPVLTRIGGRILDLLTLPDGSQRRTDFSQYRLSRIQVVREYQVIQRHRTHIEMLLVTARPLNATEKQAVQAILELEFTEGFTFAITEVPAIARTEAGKLRPFLSEVTPPG